MTVFPSLLPGKAWGEGEGTIGGGGGGGGDGGVASVSQPTVDNTKIRQHFLLTYYHHKAELLNLCFSNGNFYLYFLMSFPPK